MKMITRILIVLAVLSCLTMYGQSTESVGACPVPSVVAQDKKVLTEFRGVRLGMKTDQVRALLGKPAIQIVFMESAKAPGWTEVVGDAEVNQMESGAKFARKVVNAEHFWVSMYKSKDGTMTRITISR